jgi:DNA-binding transcriptional regulator GbsR (MarR family)
MKLDEAKQQFLQAWGTLGSNWGVSRSMAQVHAILMISPEALTTEDIMEELNISRGNANMNLRDLIDWGLVAKELRPGERKEYFSAEKDVWVIARQVAKERKRRELEPVLKVLDQVSKVEGDKKDKKVKAFVDQVGEIKKLARNADMAIDTMIKTEESWFFGAIVKLLK